jgi:hypothetical protein
MPRRLHQTTYKMISLGHLALIFCQCAAAAASALELAPRTACTGASAGLLPAECSAWQDLYNATDGVNWANCRDKRLDPCTYVCWPERAATRKLSVPAALLPPFLVPATSFSCADHSPPLVHPSTRHFSRSRASLPLLASAPPPPLLLFPPFPSFQRTGATTMVAMCTAPTHTLQSCKWRGMARCACGSRGLRGAVGGRGQKRRGQKRREPAGTDIHCSHMDVCTTGA